MMCVTVSPCSRARSTKASGDKDGSISTALPASRPAADSRSWVAARANLFKDKLHPVDDTATIPGPRIDGRFDIVREIERLDPVTDHQRIVHLSFGYEFPWNSIRALEIALYRTYCVPGISALLDRTGEFHQNTQRRYDDTSILVAEMCEWGYERGRGKEALERMNLGAQPLQDRERLSFSTCSPPSSLNRCGGLTQSGGGRRA